MIKPNYISVDLADCALSPRFSRQVVPDENHVQPAKGVKVNGEGRGLHIFKVIPMAQDNRTVYYLNKNGRTLHRPYATYTEAVLRGMK